MSGSVASVVGALKGAVIAVLALPYAEVTAVPIEENCPFTALVVEASVPPTPGEVVTSEPTFWVGQIDDFTPGDVLHPFAIETESAPKARRCQGFVLRFCMVMKVQLRNGNGKVTVSNTIGRTHRIP